MFSLLHKQSCSKHPCKYLYIYAGIICEHGLPASPSVGNKQNSYPQALLGNRNWVALSQDLLWPGACAGTAVPTSPLAGESLHSLPC